MNPKITGNFQENDIKSNDTLAINYMYVDMMKW